MDTRKMICDFCRKSVPISDIRYMPKGNDKTALCSECRNKKPVSRASVVKQPDKINLECTRCHYKFKFGDDRTNLKCPYCGKDDKLMER